jgi:hypothetical protein
MEKSWHAVRIILLMAFLYDFLCAHGNTVGSTILLHICSLRIELSVVLQLNSS